MLDRFTIVGDPHITIKSLDKGVELFKTVEAMGNPTIWLGDFLDTKEVIRGKCLNLIFESLKNSKLEHVILVGNHDWFNLECEDHSLKSLKALPNVTIVDEIKKHPKLPFVFFPYVHDKIKLKEKLKELASSELVAFGHFEVSGFDFGNGHMCEDGVVLYEDFSGFNRVISGHFHKFQQRGNFTYLGTPFSHSFGEANQDKVLGLYELSTDTLTTVATQFPKHVSLKLDLSKKNAKTQLNKFLNDNEGNLIRVQLHGSPDEVAALDKTQFALPIKWEDKSDMLTKSVALDETLDNRTQFQEWAKSVRALDPETTTLGLSILEAIGAK